MKRIVSFVLVLAAILWIVPSIVAAQATTRVQVNPTDNVTVNYVTLVGPRTYNIVHGDTLWDLNPDEWRQLQAANPKLNATDRISTTRSGLYRVLLLDNELIDIPAGLTVRISTSKPVTFVPAPQAEQKAAPANVVEKPTVTATERSSNWPWYLWVIGAIIAIIALIGHRNYARQEEMRRDPVTSGPPIVQGGVQPTEPQRLAEAVHNNASREYSRLNPYAQFDRSQIHRISPIEEGLISGTGMVGYADRARPRTINPAQPGYRARFRFPDGREDNLLSLQGCMNPCYYGEGLSGSFTFEPRSAVVPTPPERPTGPQPVPINPAIAVRALRTAAEAEGQSTITIGDRVMTIERGAHFTVDETTGVIGITGTSFEMSVKPKRQRARSADRTSATGTGN